MGIGGLPYGSGATRSLGLVLYENDLYNFNNFTKKIQQYLNFFVGLNDIENNCQKP